MKIHKPVGARPHVTDHALLRFLERSGLHVEQLRETIAEALTNAHGAALAIGGADHIIAVDGLRFVVRAGNVTTVLVTETSREAAHALAHQSR